MPDIVSRFLRCSMVQPSEVAVLFDLNLNRRPFLEYVVFLDLLLCTGFNFVHTLCSYALFFTQRSMNDPKIEQSDESRFVL